MSNFAEMNDFVKEYGKEGIRLLALFHLLKSKVMLSLQLQHPNRPFDEMLLNQLCMSRAYELLKVGKDKPTEKDIEELLSKLTI